MLKMARNHHRAILSRLSLIVFGDQDFTIDQGSGTCASFDDCIWLSGSKTILADISSKHC